MKAPTADYSPLSQALSAKSSALQASYSSKDAANWKSSYDIQQKSFGLQQDSLDLQQESIDLSRQQTNFSGAMNVFNGVLDLANTIVSAKQDDITQTLTQSSTDMANEWQTQLQMNPDYMTDDIDPDTGGATIKLTEKGQKAYTALMEKYFPSDTKYGWGMDSKASQVKESLKSSCLSYAQSQGLENIQANAGTKFNYNYSYALDSDLDSKATETVEVSDGAGGVKSLTVGSQTKAVIDARPNMTDDWRIVMYEKAAQDLVSGRTSRIETDLTTNYGNGTYILDAEARAQSDADIEACLAAIEDPSDRATAEANFKTLKSNAITTYFTNELNTIKDLDTNGYTAAKDLNNELSFEYKAADGKTTKKGKYYDLFFTTDEDGNEVLNPYILPSTYQSIKSTVNSYVDECKTTCGTLDTNKVKDGFKEYNALFEAGTINATEYGSQVDNLMKSVYGENWTENSEAIDVYFSQVGSLVPEDISSNPTVENAWNMAWQIALDKTGVNYDDLSYEEKQTAEAIRIDMLQRLRAFVLSTPSSIKNPLTYRDGINDIMDDYTKIWADFIDMAPTDVTAWETITGTEVTGKVNKIFDTLVSEWSEDIEGNINEKGIWQRSDSDMMLGVNNEVTEAITALGSKLNSEGASISDTRTGYVKFKMENGEPSRDDDGNYIPEKIVYHDSTGDIVYDIASGVWGKEVDSSPDSTVTKETVEAQELEDAKEILEGGDQEERVNEFTKKENITSDDMRDFLAKNCVNEDELDATLTLLYNKHKNGGFLSEESDTNYVRLMNAVVFSVETINGWNHKNRNVTTRAIVTPSKSEEDIAAEFHNNAFDTYQKKHSTSDTTEEESRREEQDAAADHISAFKAYERKHAQDNDPEGKRYQEKNNKDVSDTGTSGNKTPVKKEEEPEETPSTSIVTEFISQKGQRPSIKDLTELLASADDIDSTVEELKRLAGAGEIIIPKVTNRTEKEVLDNLAATAKKNKKNK